MRRAQRASGWTHRGWSPGPRTRAGSRQPSALRVESTPRTTHPDDSSASFARCSARPRDVATAFGTGSRGLSGVWRQAGILTSDFQKVCCGWFRLLVCTRMHERLVSHTSIGSRGLDL
eukprot:4868959-Prymnesium_polylepis.1